MPLTLDLYFGARLTAIDVSVVPMAPTGVSKVVTYYTVDLNVCVMQPVIIGISSPYPDRSDHGFCGQLHFPPRFQHTDSEPTTPIPIAPFRTPIIDITCWTTGVFTA